MRMTAQKYIFNGKLGYGNNDGEGVGFFFFSGGISNMGLAECLKIYVRVLPALFALSPLRGAPPKGEPWRVKNTLVG